MHELSNLLSRYGVKMLPTDSPGHVDIRFIHPFDKGYRDIREAVDSALVANIAEKFQGSIQP